MLHTQIKEQYIELAKYLRVTEDKLHHRWFQSVQKRANKVMPRPIFRKTAHGNSKTNGPISPADLIH